MHGLTGGRTLMQIHLGVRDKLVDTLPAGPPG